MTFKDRGELSNEFSEENQEPTVDITIKGMPLRLFEEFQDFLVDVASFPQSRIPDLEVGSEAADRLYDLAGKLDNQNSDSIELPHELLSFFFETMVKRDIGESAFNRLYPIHGQQQTEKIDNLGAKPS